MRFGPKKFPYECNCGCLTRKTIRSKHQEYNHLYCSMEARARIAADPSKICAKYLKQEQKRFEKHCIRMEKWVGVPADVLMANTEMREIFVRLDRAPLGARRAILENCDGGGVWAGVGKTLRAAGYVGKGGLWEKVFGIADSCSVESREALADRAPSSKRKLDIFCSESDDDSIGFGKRVLIPRAAKAAVSVKSIFDSDSEDGGEECVPPAKAARVEDMQKVAPRVVEHDPDFADKFRAQLATMVTCQQVGADVADVESKTSVCPLSRQVIEEVELMSCGGENDHCLSDISTDSEDNDVSVAEEVKAVEEAVAHQCSSQSPCGSLDLLANCAAAILKEHVSVEFTIQPAEVAPVVFVPSTKPARRVLVTESDLCTVFPRLAVAVVV